MTKILAIDTASDLCSVSILTASQAGGDVQLSSLSEHAPRSHVQRVLPMVKTLLSTAGVSVAQLDVIAFGRGPGSFTGLRISAGITQGLAFGQDLPVLAVSNLEAQALDCFNKAPNAKACLSVVDARMNEVYWALYERDASNAIVRSGDERVDAPETLSDMEALSAVLSEPETCFIVGSGLVYAERLGALYALPKLEEAAEHPAELIAHIGLEHFMAGNTLEPEQAAPVYIRDNVAWKKLPGRE